MTDDPAAAPTEAKPRRLRGPLVILLGAAALAIAGIANRERIRLGWLERQARSGRYESWLALRQAAPDRAAAVLGVSIVVEAVRTGVSRSRSQDLLELRIESDRSTPVPLEPESIGLRIIPEIGDSNLWELHVDFCGEGVAHPAGALTELRAGRSALSTGTFCAIRDHSECGPLLDSDGKLRDWLVPAGHHEAILILRAPVSAFFTDLRGGGMPPGESPLLELVSEPFHLELR